MVLNKEKSNFLTDIYFNSKNAGSYSGLNKLYLTVIKHNPLGISKSDIKKWLSSQDSYTAHKFLIRKFNRPKVIVPTKFYLFDADTAFFEKFGEENNGYKYFLILIDILSRFVWTVPLKSLLGKEVASALKSVFLKQKPLNLRTDNGKEFSNRFVNQLYNIEHINHFTTSGELKANYAERAIKTIKSKIQRYFSEKQTHTWINVLEDITTSYNNTFHRSIGMTPFEAINTRDDLLWNRQYVNVNNFKNEIKKKSNIKVGDHVKISRIKNPFQREYDERWSREIFIVTEKFDNQNIPMFTIKDYTNEPIEGRFYVQELQKVFVDENTEYKIESVLKTKKINGKTLVLIKWLGWPEKYNSYIDKKDLKKFRK